MRLIQGLLATGAAALLALAADPGAAAPLKALSPQDAQLYAQAFDAAEHGDTATADQTLAKVSDPCLAGRVQYLELTKAKTASFQELSNWLKSFGDLPGADRIYALALLRKPAGATPPPPAPEVDNAGDNIDRARPTPKVRAAREAYFDGDLRRARAVARESGDSWIAGLAAYRLGDYSSALAAFTTVAENHAESDSVRAAGAFWAARSAAAAGLADRVSHFLRIAAAAPDTFYGMIAARKLELSADPLGQLIQAAANGNGPLPAFVHADADSDGSSVRQLVLGDVRARRAVALTQIGRTMDASAEIRTGLAQASDDQQRAAWMGLMYQLGPDAENGEIVLHTAQATTPNAVYPTPVLNPAGGFTTPKALVYAVVWQESRFNSLAVSPVGAIGLMQLMPPSAANMAGDSSLTSDPVPLFDTGKNLQLGQAYLNWLMDKAVGYDLLKVVAAYNGGPTTVNKTVAMLGPNADSLTLMESVPFSETRDYVRKVVAAYWCYRRQFGAPSRTLDALASDSVSVDPRLDGGPSAAPQNPQPDPAARQALEILLHHDS